MKQVFLISRGEYSDYSIYGAFSTRELAQAFIDAFAESPYSGSKMEIEEWDLDKGVVVGEGMRAWCVRITQAGDVVEIEHEDSPYGFMNDSVGLDVRGNLFTFVFAVDQAGATKIANERRIKWLMQRGTEAKVSE